VRADEDNCSQELTTSTLVCITANKDSGGFSFSTYLTNAETHRIEDPARHRKYIAIQSLSRSVPNRDRLYVAELKRPALLEIDEGISVRKMRIAPRSLFAGSGKTITCTGVLSGAGPATIGAWALSASAVAHASLVPTLTSDVERLNPNGVLPLASCPAVLLLGQSSPGCSATRPELGCRR
jgi:hypothetical protein